MVIFLSYINSNFSIISYSLILNTIILKQRKLTSLDYYIATKTRILEQVFLKLKKLIN